MVSVSFGVSLSLHPPKEQFELVRRVEALGFDSVCRIMDISATSAEGYNATHGSISSLRPTHGADGT